MEKNNLVLIGVLVVMVVIAGVQLVQFNTLTDSLSNAKVSGNVAVNSNPAPAQSSGSGNLPGVLANLPSQVGGC